MLLLVSATCCVKLLFSKHSKKHNKVENVLNFCFAKCCTLFCNMFSWSECCVVGEMFLNGVKNVSLNEKINKICVFVTYSTLLPHFLILLNNPSVSVWHQNACLLKFMLYWCIRLHMQNCVRTLLFRCCLHICNCCFKSLHAASVHNAVHEYWCAF